LKPLSLGLTILSTEGQTVLKDAITGAKTQNTIKDVGLKVSKKKGGKP